ncbi:MAG: hypothetical protein ABL977_15340, partial [Candidatus Eisenbacteria bacterium]
MRTPIRALILTALVATSLAGPPARALEAVWGKLPARLAADSLAPALRQLEAMGPRGTSAGAAFALARLRRGMIELKHRRASQHLREPAGAAVITRPEDDDLARPILQLFTQDAIEMVCPGDGEGVAAGRAQAQ